MEFLIGQVCCSHCNLSIPMVSVQIFYSVVALSVSQAKLGFAKFDFQVFDIHYLRLFYVFGIYLKLGVNGLGIRV